ncbi:MAG: MBL fold metallo-hydrolase [Bacteroidetes bacterium]|nr:MBL fold metallo-hydrolase [Bacteroidota bacterium]
MKFISYGAAQQVTGSMHLLELDNGFKVLIDCGLDYETKKKSLTDSNRFFDFDIKSIDVVILTHAHIDHSGNLPNLIKQGYEGQILCTTPTYDFCTHLLMDSVNVQMSELNKNNSQGKRRKPKATNASDLLYTQKDVMETLRRMVTFNFEKEVELAENIHFTFIPAGHILGAASVLFKVVENGKETRFGFTGDLGRRDANLVVNPIAMERIDYLVCESTYGGKLHHDTKSPEDILMEHIQATCIDKRGRLIIPAFSVGRTQAIIYSLHKLYKQGRFNHINVYVDSPLAIESTSIYTKYHEYLNDDAREFLRQNGSLFDFPLLFEVENMRESEAISNNYEPCIIVSAAGMVEGGRIVEHVYNNLQNPQSAILIAGYCAEGTLGWKLKQPEASVTIHGKQIPKYCTIGSTDIFSSHPGHQMLVDYVKMYDPATLKKIFLVHGEQNSLEAFQMALLKEGYHVEITIKEKVYALN